MKVGKALKQLYDQTSEEVGILHGFFMEASGEKNRKDLRSLSATLKDLRIAQVKLLYALLKLEEPSGENLASLLAKLPTGEVEKAG